LQNTADLSDLVSSGRDRKMEEVALAEECELKSMVFRVERFDFYYFTIEMFTLSRGLSKIAYLPPKAGIRFEYALPSPGTTCGTICCDCIVSFIM